MERKIIKKERMSVIIRVGSKEDRKNKWETQKKGRENWEGGI